MAQFDITQPIIGYSTHFFPPDADVPVYITLYKSGAATHDDVAGYLMFTDHPVTGHYRDWLSSEHQYIVKHFRFAQFADVQALLQHRLDHQKQGMSIHYVGGHIVGGWTTLDAGASPGLDPALMPLVTPKMHRPASTNSVAAAPDKKAAAKKKPARK
jgi:hypothetical protein